LAAPRTIRRFGRTYEEFDPDGVGGGPSTWVLSSAGGGSGSGSSASPSGTFSPAGGGPLAACIAGNALYFRIPGHLDLAIGIDAAAGGVIGAPPPYMVAGLASADAIDGQLVGVVSDGQVSRADWSPVAGSHDLVPGARYYLSVGTPGMLQLACPSMPASWVVCVGQAVSERALEVELNLIARI
jgi:hypothetical protein